MSRRVEALLMTFLRVVAMGGKYLFILYATRHMSERDFGRYGLLVALCVIVVAVVAFEAYQIFIREIAQTGSSLIKRIYGLFVLLTPVGAAGISYATAILWGWDSTTALLVSLLIASEYLGTEAYRMLVAEARPLAATISLSIRSGLWAIALPLLTFIGVAPKIWSLELVIGAWLGSNIVALLPFVPILKCYFPDQFSMNRFLPEMRVIVRQVGPWVINVAAARALEYGGRFILAAMVSESASGRFTLVSMLGSLSFVAYKGVLEPTYFVKLAGPSWKDHLQPFRNELLLFIGVGSVGSAAAAYFYSQFPGKSLDRDEMAALAAIIVAYAFYSLSFSSHFVLYRRKSDWLVTWAMVASAAVSVCVGTILCHNFHLVGVSIGVLCGMTSLWVIKKYFSAGISRRPLD